MAAGRDPVTVLGELAGPLPARHAKDMRRRADGGWKDVIAGDGEARLAGHRRGLEGGGRDVADRGARHPSEHPVDDVGLSLATLRDAL